MAFSDYETTAGVGQVVSNGIVSNDAGIWPTMMDVNVMMVMMMMCGLQEPESERSGWSCR